jgi:hypothetical protein
MVPGNYIYKAQVEVESGLYIADDSPLNIRYTPIPDPKGMFPAVELFDWENGGECIAMFPDHALSPQCAPIKGKALKKMSELSLGVYKDEELLAHIVRPGTLEQGLNERVTSEGYADLNLSAAMPILDASAIVKSAFFKDFGPYEYYFFDGATTHYSGYDIIKGEYTLKLKIKDEDGVTFEKSYPVMYDYDNDYNNMWGTGVNDQNIADIKLKSNGKTFRVENEKTGERYKLQLINVIGQFLKGADEGESITIDNAGFYLIKAMDKKNNVTMFKVVVTP